MSLPFYNNVYFIVNNNDSKFCSNCSIIESQSLLYIQ